MDVEQLILKYLTGGLSADEQEQLDQWLAADESHRALFRDLVTDHTWTEHYRTYRRRRGEAAEAFQAVWNRTDTAAKRKKIRKMLYACMAGVACVALLLIAFPIVGVHADHSPIIPGSAKALLTLEGGRTESLDSSFSRRWIYLEDKPVGRVDDGVLSYRFASAVHLRDTHWHTLSVPRGGEYHLVLGDGTRVHLNALSELSFPIAFSRDAPRTVRLSGEAYFEVAKDSLRPFRILTQGVIVQQLGTSFNVKARTPGQVEVALVEGKVKLIVPQGQQVLLSPGELGTWQAAAQRLEAHAVDTGLYTAWHADRFLFYNESLEELMQELSLWYDIDVVFADERLKQLHFTGNLHRYDDISVILNAIGQSVDVHFSVSGHQVRIDKLDK